MLTKEDVEKRINSLMQEKLFAAIRKIIISNQRNKLLNSTEYLSSSKSKKKELLDSYYKIWYDSISNFFLSFRSIYALDTLVNRELKIREFTSKEVVRIKVDYIYNNIEFSLYYPTHYDLSMMKEVEDCINDLKNPKYSHIVDNYTPRKDTEHFPHEPLTLAELKYSSFYLYGYRPEYVTKLATLIFKAGLITDPETNGWNIEDSIVEDIITMLNKKYSEDKVLQYKRKFSDNVVDRTLQECIRPKYLTIKYFPKFIENTDEFASIQFKDKVERSDAIKLYKFIYYVTLSTQMKNSIYDTSVLEIVVGPKKLKEQANELIKGQENWELLSGEVLKRITKNSSTESRQTVVLPEIPHGVTLRPQDIYYYTYQSKRPPRYGIGRFVTQVLEKNSIGSYKEHDAIVSNIIASKAVLLVKTMLHPQESAVELIRWLHEHIPSLVDLEYLYELEEKILLAVKGEISVESILEEINRLIESGFNSSGFIFDEALPSDAKIKLLRAVALKNKLVIDDSVYKSNVKIDMILAQYPAETPIKIGSCPSCNALVFQKEFINSNTGEVSYYFSCEKFNINNGCSFSIWDSYIHKYFSDKSMELLNVEERADVLKKILSKKRGYLFNGFIGKNQKPYDAKVYIDSYIEKDTKKTKWNFSLKFVNKRNRKS